MLFQGCATALITPFKNNKIDFDALDRMIDMQYNAGVTGFLACGTTGEPPAMTEEERDSVVKFILKKMHGKACVVAGAGSNNTAASVATAKKYASLGVDAVLVVTPYYNKCTQKGLIEHYRSICEGAKIPVIAYNVPGRTGVNIVPDTYDELVKIPHMAGVKEASSNFLQIDEISRRIAGKMALYSGDDEMVIPFYPMGGKGVFSVASNIIPDVMVNIWKLCEANKPFEAQALADKYARLNKLLFCEVNPIPAKAAASLMGLCSDEIRLPLTKLEPQHMAELSAELKLLGLIK